MASGTTNRERRTMYCVGSAKAHIAASVSRIGYPHADDTEYEHRCAIGAGTRQRMHAHAAHAAKRPTNPVIPF